VIGPNSGGLYTLHSLYNSVPLFSKETLSNPLFATPGITRHEPFHLTGDEGVLDELDEIVSEQQNAATRGMRV